MAQLGAALAAADGAVIATFGIVGGCYALLVGVIWKFVEHANAHDSHPRKGDIVFRDTCEVNHAGLDKALDAKFEATNKRIDDLKDEMNRNFGDLKRLVLNGHGRKS